MSLCIDLLLFRWSLSEVHTLQVGDQNDKL